MDDTLEDMLYATRTVRFAEIVDTYGGPTAFVAELEKRLQAYPELSEGLKTFHDTTYVSNATAGRKRIGEAVALTIEFLFEKPNGWMTGDAYENFLIKLRRRHKATG